MTGNVACLVLGRCTTCVGSRCAEAEDAPSEAGGGVESEDHA